MSALHWAATKGDAQLVGVLLRAGASVTATTRIDRATPLHMAAAAGSAPAIDALLGPAPTSRSSPRPAPRR